jgi:hypothetical protein
MDVLQLYRRLVSARYFIRRALPRWDHMLVELLVDAAMIKNEKE